MEVYSEAQLELKQLTMDSLEKHQHEMAALWFRYGDRCSKQFFTFYKSPHKKVNIHSLRIGSQSVTDQTSKHEAITDFYRTLYTEDPDSVEVHESKHII